MSDTWNESWSDTWSNSWNDSIPTILSHNPMYYDQVKELTTTNGINPLTLDGPFPAHQSFAIVTNNNQCYYLIVDPYGSNWEVGLGTYHDDTYNHDLPPKLIRTLTRDSILASSYSNQIVDFPKGAKEVSLIQPASILAPLFNHYIDESTTNIDGTEDILYEDLLPASTLFANGSKIEIEYEIESIPSLTATRQIQVYIAGTKVADTTVFVGAQSTYIHIIVIRDSNTTLKIIAIINGTTIYTHLTSIDFTNTINITLTGIAGGVAAAPDDIVAKYGGIKRA